MTERDLDAFSNEKPSNARSSLQEKLAARKDRLTPVQAQQFAERIHGETDDIRVAGGIRRQPMAATRPLSFSQERVWFLQQLDPADRSLIRPVAVRLVGELNVALLEQSLSEIPKRHELLRATFNSAEGSPYQRIAPVRPIKLRVEDLSDLPADDRDSRTYAILKESVRELFDLNTGPILRGTLVRWGMEEHILLLVTHHIIFDAWSSEILIDELFTVYGQLARGSHPNLPALPITYADYARWQKQQFEDRVLDDSLKYWTDTLHDLPERVELPTDRPRRAPRTSDGNCERLRLNQDLVRDLESLARSERTTLFSVLLAAFAVLIQRYTGMEDFLVGTPVAGRTEIETEDLIGPFVNTIVLRCDLSADPTVRELVGRIREMTLNALEHQDVPFEKVVEAVHPDREPGRAPLFDVMFNLENVPHRSPSSAELTVEPYALDVIAVGIDFLAEIHNEADGSLTCEFAYRTDLFDSETIQRALVHYEMLLRGLTEDANRPISEIPMLSATERHRLLVEWNDTERAYPETRCVHELFESQVRQFPDAPAVTFGDETLTYRELNQRANQLAHRLRHKGVSPDTPVGLCVERSIEMLVGILAILKAGGAYVPLDPGFPLERLQFMSSDADLLLILTQARLIPKLSSLPRKLLCIDDAQLTTDKVDLENLSPVASPDNLAYIIYTSGSTGSPKGVLIDHRGVVSYFSCFSSVFGLRSDDVVLQIASFSFDLSIRDLICPITIGAHIVLASDVEVRDPSLLIKKIDKHGATALGSTPSLLTAIVDVVRRTDSDCRSLRRIISGGEALPADLASRILETFDGRVRLSNEYGPTECTMTSAHYEVTRTQSRCPIVLLGRPLPNVQMYVLDTHLRPLPIGIPGEIHIGGIGLARGYLNRPDLTAERFISNPFDPGKRLYKTGDMGRWLASGELEFLGRADRQIKLRGYRIELGEIEAVLCEFSRVRQAVVEVYEAVPGERQLVAYLTSDVTSGNLAASLREHLRARLPRYMIPSRFVVLDRLPLTTRGKVDYSALPRPSGSQRSLAEPFLAPRTPFEKEIAAIWEEILNIDRIGVHDDFFDLGGHSLSLMRVAAAIDQKLGVRPSILTLYEAPTIEGQSIALLRECDKLKTVEDRDQ